MDAFVAGLRSTCRFEGPIKAGIFEFQCQGFAYIFRNYIHFQVKLRAEPRISQFDPVACISSQHPVMGIQKYPRLFNYY